MLYIKIRSHNYWNNFLKIFSFNYSRQPIKIPDHLPISRYEQPLGCAGQLAVTVPQTQRKVTRKRNGSPLRKPGRSPGTTGPSNRRNSCLQQGLRLLMTGTRVSKNGRDAVKVTCRGNVEIMARNPARVGEACLKSAVAARYHIGGKQPRYG